MQRYVSHVPIIVGATLVAALTIAPSPAAQEQRKNPQPTGAVGKDAASVDLDELEDNPEKFLGKTVTVEGEVDRILGPHLFTVDEPNWVDPERELPVLVPDPFAAIVRTDAPVRVTGTVQKIPIAQIEKEYGFLRSDPKIKAEVETSPVLVATEVTATIPAAVSLRVRTDQPVGTSGTGATAPITNADQLARSTDTSMVGRRVDLKTAQVDSPSEDGFWIRLPSGERIFVMTAKKTDVRQGQSVAVQGVVLELPEGLRVKLNAGNEPVYIYAEQVGGR